MNESKISTRYSKAIFSYAKDNNNLTEVYEDFSLIKGFFSYSSELMSLISSPIIKIEEKLAIINNVFSKMIGKTALHSLRFIVQKGREEFILTIIYDFEELYRKEKNIKEVVITTSKEINTATKEKISEIVDNVYKSNVEIKNVIDDSMIGGFKLRIDNNMLDLSVKTQIEQIKKILKQEK